MGGGLSFQTCTRAGVWVHTRKGYGAPLGLGGSFLEEGSEKPPLHTQANASRFGDGGLSQCQMHVHTG